MTTDDQPTDLDKALHWLWLVNRDWEDLLRSMPAPYREAVDAAVERALRQRNAEYLARNAVQRGEDPQ